MRQVSRTSSDVTCVRNVAPLHLVARKRQSACVVQRHVLGEDTEIVNAMFGLTLSLHTEATNSTDRVNQLVMRLELALGAGILATRVRTKLLLDSLSAQRERERERGLRITDQMTTLQMHHT